MKFNEADVMADLTVLLEKHGIKAGMLLVPIDDGTAALRINVDDESAAGIMISVAEDLLSGEHPSHQIKEH